MKRKALQKFISENILKEDYKNLVSLVQDKLLQLEVEKQKTKKIMAESHSTSKLTTIKKHLE